MTFDRRDEGGYTQDGAGDSVSFRLKLINKTQDGVIPDAVKNLTSLSLFTKLR